MTESINEMCDTCGHEHGPLYICPHYSDERKSRIAERSKAWVRQLNNPDWIQRQVDKHGEDGLIAVVVQRVFAGLAPGNKN